MSSATRSDMQAQVQNLYRSVIDDLIGRVKPDFQEAGLDEAILDELRVLWEAKLSESGALDSPAYRQFEESQRPRSSAAHPAGAARVSNPTGIPRVSTLAGVTPTSGYPRPIGALGLNPSVHQNWQHQRALQQSQQEKQQYLQHQQQHSLPYPSLPPGVGQPAARLQSHSGQHDSGERVAGSLPGASALPSHLQQYAVTLQSGHLPLFRPAPGAVPLSASQLPAGSATEAAKRKREAELQILPPAKLPHLSDNGHSRQQLPQTDGAGDADDSDSDLDDEGAAKLLEDLDSAAKEEQGQAQEKETFSDVELDDDQPDSAETWKSHKIICQFDKVRWTKTKWQCQLRDGIMNIHGQDMIFKTADADLQFT